MLRRSVLKTLVYAEVFSFPLTAWEVWYWLVGDRKGLNGSVSEVRKCLHGLKDVRSRGGYFMLSKSGAGWDMRQKSKFHSERKLDKARDLKKFFKWIPHLEMVAVTGSTAAGNAKEDDDIDLLVVTSSGRLWTTRLLCVLLLECLGVRRRPMAMTGLKDKICLNLFLDKRNLLVEKEKRDLYLAHEILQARVIWDRNGTYADFLRVNEWSRRWLPNAWLEVSRKFGKVDRSKTNFEGNLRSVLMNRCESMLEWLVRNLQMWYMHGRRTGEVVGAGRAAFHPFDYRLWVMNEYRRKLKDFVIMGDNG
jgi:predicted nucleotidyltransferase